MEYKRFITRVVKIGEVAMGGSHPVRVQTMTNTDTNDIEASVNQCIKIYQNGTDLIRLTTQGLKEVENLKKIYEKLKNSNILLPLIADVHFNPKVAESAAMYFPKVRINPGNYAGKNKGKTNYSNKEYHLELSKIKNNLKPLIKICKYNQTAIRLGINHGSLSERIILKYGNTPKGMVVSAMEFLKVFHEENFHNLVISMKASNVQIMVQSCRLFVSEMRETGLNYPIHLGVTEAGEGEDGRIKSAIGIGAMLNDGIGDTVRVSLTENPENEIPVARKIVGYCTNKKEHPAIQGNKQLFYDPFTYNKRKTAEVFNIGGKNKPIVLSNCLNKAVTKGQYKHDYCLSDDFSLNNDLKKNEKVIIPYSLWRKNDYSDVNTYPLFSDSEFENASHCSDTINFIRVINKNYSQSFYKKALSKKGVFVLTTEHENGYADQRAFFNTLLEKKITVPVIIERKYNEKDLENLQIKSACDIGPLLIDGFGDGIFINYSGALPPNDILSTSFGILQASRVRISKTEYISCPGCGRTKFNLQDAVSIIKQKTSRLKGLKIGVMGCIVNGPGEMADADYGYVGSGNGKITLYKNKEVVKKNIPEKDAVEELIDIIKENGDWKD